MGSIHLRSNERLLWKGNAATSTSRFGSFHPRKEKCNYPYNTYPSSSLASNIFRLYSTVGEDVSGISNENSAKEDNDGWFNSQDEDDDAEGSSIESIDAAVGEDEEEQNPFAQALGKSIQKALKKKTKMQASLQSELDKAEALESTVKRANLILANLYQIKPGTSVITVQDWDLDGEDVELTLNTKKYSNAQEEADALFSKAKRMKRGSAVVKEILERVDEALELLKEATISFDAAVLEEAETQDSDMIQARLNLILDRLERSSNLTGFQLVQAVEQQQQKSKRKPSPGKKRKSREPTFRRFKSANGCIVLVGRNRRDNEALCFQVSRGDDVWMHSRGCPGAHVLLQIRRGSPRPNNEDFQFAADLAAFYSDARTERKAPITTADAKHIQKPRGAPLGAVKVRQERETWVGFPENVDDELKVAREESGVAWDESGSRSLGGKAKNRKYTKEVAKQTLAKRKAQRKKKRNQEGGGSGDAEGGSWY